MTDKLLEYHIAQSERRFAELKEETALIRQKIDDLQEFKVSILVSSRWISFAVSGVVGIATIVLSAVISHLVKGA